MEIWIREQAISAAAALVLGIITGAAYDVLKLIYALFCLNVREMNRFDPRRLIVFILDLLFCLAFAAAYAVVTYAFSYGQFRLFMLLSAAAGFISYAVTLGRLVSYLTDRIVSFIRRGAKTVLRLILVPVKLLLNIFKSAGKILRSALLFIYRVTLGKVIGKLHASASRRYTEKIMEELSTVVRFDN